MEVFRGLSEVPPGFGPSVVAIGNFDGVHCGHRAILHDLCARAAAQNARAVAITFDPHPLKLLRPLQAPRLLTPLPARLPLLDQTGLGATLVLPFTEAFSQYSAEHFAVTVLARCLRAVEVHEGDNFRFGRNASAGMEELRMLGARLGFSVKRHPVLVLRGTSVSSSEGRTLVAAGEVSRARALLGRPFSVHSTQARGRGIGTRLLVPTVNLARYDELLPGNGVYVTRLSIAGEPFDAVTNVGNRPTFGEDSFAVESYILNYREVELTPETPLELTFLQRIRGERRFESPELLKGQIMKDVAHAQRYLRLMRSLQRGRLS